MGEAICSFPACKAHVQNATCEDFLHRPSREPCTGPRQAVIILSTIRRFILKKLKKTCGLLAVSVDAPAGAGSVSRSSAQACVSTWTHACNIIACTRDSAVAQNKTETPGIQDNTMPLWICIRERLLPYWPSTTVEKHKCSAIVTKPTRT